MTPEIHRIGTSRDLVGESPYWDPATGRLIWVDIVGKVVRSYHPATDTEWSHQTTDFPTAIAATPDGAQAVLTQGREVGMFDFATRQFRAFVTPDQAGGALRLNEGKCDPQGRFWVASMDNNLNSDATPRQMGLPRGRLFRLDGAQAVPFFGADLGIPNTMAWSPAGDLFYFGDTLLNTLWVCDVDPATGDLSNRRVFAEGGAGLPDGSCIDSAGCLWNARFSAGCLIRFAPDGSVDQVLELPCKNPTSCTFGGPDLRTLYITSGAFGLEAPSDWDGALMAVDLPVAGLPDSPYRGAGL